MNIGFLNFSNNNMAIEVLKTGVKKFTHIVHLADIHVRLTKRHDEYLEVFSRLYKEIEKTPPTTAICVLGDVVHSKVDLSPECVQTTKDLLVSLADLRPTILVSGNHDANLTNRNRLDSLTPIVDAIKHPNLYYLLKSGLYAFGNICINNYSVFDNPEKYISGSSIPSTYRNEYEYFVSLFHGPVNNALTDLGYHITSKSSPVEMFDGHDITLLGDIHMKQDLQHYDASAHKPFIHYPGSLIQQNHGETLKDHGISLWDLEKRNYQHIEIPNDYGYYSVLVSKGVLDTDIKDIPKKVRLRIQCFESVATEVKAALSKIRLVSSVVEVAYVRIESPDDKKQISVVGSNISLGNLSDSDYQNTLLSEYLKKRLDITDQAVIDEICKINKEVNLAIDKDDFAKNIRWRPKKFEWDNMFSYGEGNVIDFTKLKDVVGLFAANTSGKSNILSALSFCIFDKCEREFKAVNILNVQKMGFRCKFNFEINGVDYFIERSGNSDKKGMVKVNVRFWKEENGQQIELHGEGRRDTDDIIRDYLGTYEDFVLTSLSVQNLKNNAGSFIDMGHTERKDLLAMFMGLTIFDRLYNKSSERQKELCGALKLYRNDDFTKKLVEYSNAHMQASSVFNEETKRASELTKQRDVIQQSIMDETAKLIPLESNIPSLKDSTEIKNACEGSVIELTIKIDGHKKISEELDSQVKIMETSVKSMEEMELAKHYKEYQQLIQKKNTLQSEIEKKKVEVKHKIERVRKAKEYKYDPNCQYCMANANDVVREAAQAEKELTEFKGLVDQILLDQAATKNRMSEIEWVVSQYDAYTKLLEKRNKSKDELTAANDHIIKLTKKLEVVQDKLRIALESIQLYHKNKSSIENNVEISARIIKLKKDLANVEFEIKKINKNILELNGKITVFKTNIEEITLKVQKAKAIESEHKAYEMYVQAVGRDGIPYEVISNMVPEIEREVNNILSQIVEFHVHFEIDGKNVIPYIVYDNRRWLMSLTSGFEKFVLSLAIRVALINVSNLPRPNFLVIDEGFGVLDAENLASMQTLFSYLKTNFDFIMVISHLDTLRDMVDNQIEIKKENGFSKVNFE